MKNSNQSKSWLLSGLFILWVLAVLIGFYSVKEQKPFAPAQLLGLINTLLDLLAAVWIGLLGLGLGHRLLRWLNLSGSFKTSAKVADLSTGEIFVLGTGVGLGVLGLLTLGLGLAGLFQRWLFIVLSIILTALLWPDWLALRRRLRGWPPQESRPDRLIALYVVVVGLCTLAVALLPPIDWDGLFYHLTAPKIFIQMGRIAPGMDVPHFNFPFLEEMLFAYGLLLRGDIAAKLIHALYSLLLTGLVYLTARRCLSRESAWPAVLVLLSMPMIPTLAGWAYNDLALAFYQVAALYALLRSEKTEASPQGAFGSSQGAVDSSQNLNYQLPIPKGHAVTNYHPHWLILSGIFAGLAMGLKYTSFIAPLTIGLMLIWWQVKTQVASRPLPSPIPRGHTVSNLQSLFAILSFALPALLVALPWYLKNFFFTGNPFYPFAANWFDGLYWDQFRADWYAQAGTGIGFDGLELLKLPILLTLGIKDVNYFDGRTGPLFLAFLPLILLYGLFRYRAAARPPALNILLIFALIQFCFWTLGVIWSRSLWQSRLLLPCFVALSPVVGWLWVDLKHLDRSNLSIRRLVNGLISLVLGLTLLELSLNFVQINPLAYLSGHESRAEYLTRRLGAYYATMEQLNQTLPPTAEVLFLWEPRSYFCHMTCHPDSILDQLAHDQFIYDDAAAIVAAWKKAGITHVLLHRQGLDFIKQEGMEAVYRPALRELAVMEKDYFEPVFDVVGAYQLYKLR